MIRHAVNRLAVATLVLVAGCSQQTIPTTTTTTTTVDQTTTTSVPGDASNARSLPAAAEETALRIFDLAESGDIEGLADFALADEGMFTASFGQGFEDPAALGEFWRGEQFVADTIAALVGLPDWFETRAVDQSGQEVAIFVTPRFMHEPTEENRRLLEGVLGADRVEASIADGQYLGPRLGITEDGHWQFFIIGGD